MNAKKAAAYERRAGITETLRPKIEEIKAKLNADPWGYDYKEALAELIKEHGEEKLIMELWAGKK